MSSMNPNSMTGSVVTEHDNHTTEEQYDEKPQTSSFIDIDILKELQRELHLLDIENEFHVKVENCFYLIGFKYWAQKLTT